jgi:hypothetical protein
MPRIIPNGGGPGLVLFDDEPRLFGILMPMVERPYPDSIIGKLLGKGGKGVELNQ